MRVGFSSAQNLARVLSEGEADVHVGFPQAIGVGTPKRSGAPGHTQQPYGLNPAKDTTKNGWMVIKIRPKFPLIFFHVGLTINMKKL